MKTLNQSVTEILNNHQIVNSIEYLRSRWKDEKEYEDFNDYSNRIKNDFDGKFDDWQFIKATKSPFGFHAKSISFNQEISIFFKTKPQGFCLAAKGIRKLN